MLRNIRNKYVIRNINLSFLALWKMVKIFKEMFVIFNMITNSFLVEKRGTLERAIKYVCKNLLYFDCQDSIRFGIYQVAYKWRIIWEEFLFLICCKISWQKLQIFVWKTFLKNKFFIYFTLTFFNVMNVRRFKAH